MGRSMFSAIFPVALIILASSSIPPSLSQDVDLQEYGLARELCAASENPKQCLDIIRANYDKFNTNVVGVLYTSLDLARAKAVENLDIFNRNEYSKDRYYACIYEYNSVVTHIDEAKKQLNYGGWDKCDDSYKVVIVLRDVLSDGMMGCGYTTSGGEGTAPDTANVMDRNKEFKVLAQIAKVAGERVAGLCTP